MSKKRVKLTGPYSDETQRYMTSKPTELPFANGYLLPGGIVVGVVLVVLSLGASYASATTLREAADAAVSLAPSLNEAPVPALPNVPPPAIPPAPIAAPVPPPVKVPTVPSSPSPSPSRQTEPTQVGGEVVHSGAGAGLSSVGEVTSGGKQAGEGVTSTSAEAARQGASSVRNEPDPSSDRQSGHDPGATTNSEAGAGSVETAEAAPLRRWLAYVWPAVALGPVARVLAILLPSWRGMTSPPPLAVARLLSAVTGVSSASGPFVLSAQAASSDASRPDPLGVFLPDGGGMSLFASIAAVLAALIGVVALARLTVGEDFFSLRWLR